MYQACRSWICTRKKKRIKRNSAVQEVERKIRDKTKRSYPQERRPNRQLRSGVMKRKANTLCSLMLSRNNRWSKRRYVCVGDSVLLPASADKLHARSLPREREGRIMPMDGRKWDVTDLYYSDITPIVQLAGTKIDFLKQVMVLSSVRMEPCGFSNRFSDSSNEPWESS